MLYSVRLTVRDRQSKIKTSVSYKLRRTHFSGASELVFEEIFVRKPRQSCTKLKTKQNSIAAFVCLFICRLF